MARSRPRASSSARTASRPRCSAGRRRPACGESRGGARFVRTFRCAGATPCDRRMTGPATPGNKVNIGQHLPPEPCVRRETARWHRGFARRLAFVGFCGARKAKESQGGGARSQEKPRSTLAFIGLDGGCPISCAEFSKKKTGNNGSAASATLSMMAAPSAVGGRRIAPRTAYRDQRCQRARTVLPEPVAPAVADFRSVAS
jgi:hypothetical protein